MEIRIRWSGSGDTKESQVFETVYGKLFIRRDPEHQFYAGKESFSLLYAETGEAFEDNSDLQNTSVADIKYGLSKIVVKFKINWAHSDGTYHSQIFKTVHGPLFIQETSYDYVLLNAGDGTPFYGLNDEMEDALPEEIVAFLNRIIIKPTKEN